jgi:hypothetical protein
MFLAEKVGSEVEVVDQRRLLRDYTTIYQAADTFTANKSSQRGETRTEEEFIGINRAYDSPFHQFK